MTTVSEAAKKAKLKSKFLQLKNNSRTLWNQNRKVLTELVFKGNDEEGIREAEELPAQINDVLKSLINIKSGVLDLTFELG